MKPVAFGKLPAHGDFVSRGLSPSQSETWDGWFAGAIESGRSQFANRFSDVHGSAPAWRFLLGAGRLGSGWRVGAIAPSVDSVGRAFFIMAGYEAATPDARAFLAAECAELALREAIISTRNIDELMDLLAGAMPHHAAIADWSINTDACVAWTLSPANGDGAAALPSADLSNLAALVFGEAGA